MKLIPSYLELRLSSEEKKIKNTYKIDKLKNYKIVLVDDPNEELEILSIDIEKGSLINNIYITTRDSKTNKKYKLMLLNGLKFEYEDGGICEETEFYFNTVSEPPTILNVESTSPIHMIIYFTKEMVFNKDILDPKRYIFENKELEVVKVERNDTNSVKLLTSKQMPGRMYQLRII